jgi:hypothetical protein
MIMMKGKYKCLLRNKKARRRSKVKIKEAALRVNT